MKLVVFGATSGLAQQVARLAASEGASLHLVARDAAKLAAVKADLEVRGAAKVGTTVADLGDLDALSPALDAAQQALGGFDHVLVAQGVLTDEARASHDPHYLEQALRVNYVGCAFLAEDAARRLAGSGGVVAVITSVAGDRGKSSNPAYGASKAALAAHLSGLRQRLGPGPVTILDLRVGQADTPMTAHMKKGALFADAETVGRGILEAMRAQRDVAYVPARWRPLMRVIREIPEPVFKRLKL